MNREIIFRAKRKNWEQFSKEEWWIEGNIIEDGLTGQVFMHAAGNSVNESDKVNEEGCLKFFAFEVDPDTICQYTGLNDKNGKKIWENNIVKRTDLHSTKEPSVGFITYDIDNTAFLICWTDVINYSATYPWKDRIEVIGNIFDNPELLG